MRRVLAELVVASFLLGGACLLYRVLRNDRRRYVDCVDACLQEHVCQSRWACSKTCDN